MRVAVLGGGLQGCCIALALARRGVDVTLFERDEALLRGASANNEGKIHLGYVYACDRSIETARLMIKGALAFSRFLDIYLGDPGAIARSTPFTYAVHRDSQIAPAEVAAHFRRVDEEISALSERGDAHYFGADLFSSAMLDRAGLARAFNPDLVQAAIQTPELAINPVRLCAALRARVMQEPRIETRLGETIVDVAGREAPYCVSTVEGGQTRGFDQIVNALWAGRLVLDAKRGLTPSRPWLHRVKYGFFFHQPDLETSSTIVLGPFGDTTVYDDGWCFLSWYPAGLQGMGGELAPPPIALSEPARERMREASFEAIAAIVPEFGRLGPEARRLAEARGGVITATAKTDIVDPQSELHMRSDIGVSSQAGYHSVDTGKFTMAPYFAEACAARILSLECA